MRPPRVASAERLASGCAGSATMAASSLSSARMPGGIAAPAAAIESSAIMAVARHPNTEQTSDARSRNDFARPTLFRRQHVEQRGGLRIRRSVAAVGTKAHLKGGDDALRRLVEFGALRHRVTMLLQPPLEPFGIGQRLVVLRLALG